jgi:hypothetical protein
VNRPVVLPSVTRPQSPMAVVCPTVSDTLAPSIWRSLTVPFPSVAATLLAVTAPPKSESDSSATWAVRHVEPLAVDESKERNGTFAG